MEVVGECIHILFVQAEAQMHAARMCTLACYLCGNIPSPLPWPGCKAKKVGELWLSILCEPKYSSFKP